MNKILNINLGGYALTIDDDAYEYLSAYLDSLRRRFSESEGRDEIVRDIEARLGELITQDMGARTIVMLPDVEAAVQVMGKPEDFGGEPVSSASSGAGMGSYSGPRSRTTYRPGRRLFRDEDDKVAGGVASGLSAYFGIQDPVWLRLLFVILTFVSGGFWIPAYLLLWILVPPATTAADRLAMRGEPINVDNIAREIEEGFDRFGNRVSELGRDPKKKGHGTGRDAGGVLRTIVRVIGQLFALAVQFFLKFGVLIAILVGIGLFIALIVSWISGIWGLAVALPYLDYISPYDRGGTWLAVINAFFLIGIPVIAIFLLLIRVVLRKRTPGTVKAGLGLLWVLNLFSAIGLLTYGAAGFREAGEISKTPDLSSLRSDTLRVEWTGNRPARRYHNRVMNIEGLRLDRNGLTFEENVQLRVHRSTVPFFEVSQTVEARGRTTDEAVENAGVINYELTTVGNKLQVPTEYFLPKGQKWRAQEIAIDVGVPEGKFIVFGPGVHQRVIDVEYVDDNGRHFIYNNPDRVYQMTAQGLVCIDCPKLGEAGYEEDRHYEDFFLEGDFRTEINQGEDFKIEIDGESGGKAGRDLLRTVRTGDKLTLTTNGVRTNGAVLVRIQTPVFTKLFADGGNITIRGFEEGRAKVDLKNNAQLHAFFDCSQLDLNLNGPCLAELRGEGDRLDATLAGGAILEAGSWQTSEAEVSAQEKSKARLHVKSLAIIRSSADSEVRVEGGAEVRRPQDAAERMD
jgi:phage shock protein PspC (stress-responsive transcriptional regulator)